MSGLNGSAAVSVAGGEYAIDGGAFSTATGTVLVRDIRSGSDGSNPQYLTRSNGRLFFTADDGVVGREAWVSDGLDTVLLKDINPGTTFSGNSIAGRFEAAHGRTYFVAYDGVHGIEPWRSDGTAEGTTILLDVNLGPGSGARFPE